MTDAGVLVATISRPVWGGVATMTMTLMRHLQRHGLHVTYVYSLDRRETGNATLRRLLRGRWKVGQRHEAIDGFGGLGIGRRLPSIEIFHYLTSLPEWLRWADPHTALQVVGGTSHCGLAFAVSGRPFACWVATTLDEDRMGRYDASPAWRRLWDRLQRPALRRIEGYVLRKASVVMALSQYTADLIHDRYGVPWGRIEVVRQPIDVDLFHPGPTDTRGPCVVMVGRFNDGRKNVSLLLHAFAHVRAAVPDARLLLIGEVPSDATRRTVAALKLEGCVDFPGTLPHRQTAEFYRQGSVFVFSSDQEGLGIAALEAMASGLPVVSTRCGGPEEFVRDGVNGFLVDRQNPGEMGTRIVELLQNPALRARLGRAARRYIEDHYSEKTVLTAFDRVYRRVWPGLLPS